MLVQKKMSLLEPQEEYVEFLNKIKREDRNKWTIGGQFIQKVDRQRVGSWEAIKVNLEGKF